MPSHKELANAIRMLSVDAVQKANSGHPGMPMGMADIAEVLWNEFLIHNPNDPSWINRDRFIISNGHGSMLLYSLLYLTGYKSMSIDDIKAFRQLGSKTPGHPECDLTPGVETTTGPLGQGIANAVGMAIAERCLSEQFNRKGNDIIDHHTYVFMGDGCMMEGISHEACSVAGHLGLGKLIAFWDDNGISIDGKVSGWFSDDVQKRFESYNWHVISAVDGHDPEAIRKAILEAKSVEDKPTLICCKTTIAFGSPNLAGSEKAHGAALGDKEVALTREQLGWSYPPFEIPGEILDAWNKEAKGKNLQNEWEQKWIAYQKEFSDLAKELQRRLEKQLPNDWKETVNSFIKILEKKTDPMATRKSSQECLNAYGTVLPELLGGSADLSDSNNTMWSGSNTITPENLGGNYIHYGVREFGMSAIMNGIALHGGFIPYGGTFLVFSDYARNAIRLSAIMKQRVIYVLTHDSVWLGEDGPTHQPIEHASMLRMTPELSLWRPCDAIETAVAWNAAIERKDGPTCLLLSRQALHQQTRDQTTIDDIAFGGYVLKDCDEEPEVIIIATGSEVELAVKAHEELTKQGKKIRVVSMPSVDVFEKQTTKYKESVLPSYIAKRVAIEAGATACWYKYVGLHGFVIGIDQFGASAPAKDLVEHFGFSVENIINIITGMFAETIGEK